MGWRNSLASLRLQASGLRASDLRRSGIQASNSQFLQLVFERLLAGATATVGKAEAEAKTGAIARSPKLHSSVAECSTGVVGFVAARGVGVATQVSSRGATLGSLITSRTTRLSTGSEIGSFDA